MAIDKAKKLREQHVINQIDLARQERRKLDDVLRQLRREDIDKFYRNTMMYKQKEEIARRRDEEDARLRST